MTTRLNTSLLRRSLLALAATLCVGHSAFA